MEIELTPVDIKNPGIRIPKRYRKLFPEFYASLTLVTDKGKIESRAALCQPNALEIHKGMTKWFRANDLKAGDKIRISVIEPMTKYRLEMVK
jgi:hypothetical protein